MPKRTISHVVCQLSPSRKVEVRRFKGRVYVDIREFYIDFLGDELPGRRGIALTLEQWDTLKGNLKDIQKIKRLDSAD